jgi:hypothetical protein
VERPPKWFTPVAVVALLWNLFGCAAYIMDVRLTPDDVAKMSAAQQAMYAARPAWAIGATALAVWCGALGCVALLLRKGWAVPLFLVSLLGVIGQDVWLFALSGSVAQAGGAAIVLQGVVLVVAIALLLLARNAAARSWIG